MRDELVTFPTAQLAKQAGCNPKTLTYYDEDELLFTASQAHRWNDIHDRVAAPTQSALQRWLRETRGVHVELHNPFGHILTWGYDLYVQPLFVGSAARDTRYVTFEQALEAALFECLERNLVSEQFTLTEKTPNGNPEPAR